MNFSPSLMPHAVCWREDPPLIWTMAITNAITFVSYSSICATLFYLVRKARQAIPREWVLIVAGFALFIVACGSTHLLEVVTTWTPIFWVAAGANILTAALSGIVAVEFLRRASRLGLSVNDYAKRLADAESEKARIEDSLLAARKLEEWNRMSASVAHEINNPLAAIQNLLFLIEADPAIAPGVAAMAHQASDEVQRIGTIAKSTLGFFRQNQRPERVDLRDSAESVRSLLEPLARQKGIHLMIESTGDCTVIAYSMETRQVLLNLVRNACEATTQRGAEVRICLAGGASEVRVLIEDQGAGIPPEMLGNLFKFGASSKGDRGNGMGLWTVKKLVDRHGGTIAIESKVEEGTRVTTCWPRQLAAWNLCHSPIQAAQEAVDLANTRIQNQLA